MAEPFSWKKWFSGFGDFLSNMKDLKTVITIILLLFVAVTVWRAYFSKRVSNISQPRVVALPGSHIEKIEQPTTQVYVEPEKTWEVGVGAAVLQFDNKNGGILGGWIKKKW